jgi:hypothetical protein
VKRMFNLRFWATGGWFSVAYIAVGVAVVGIGLEAYGMSEQAGAARNAAGVDLATAAYNQKYDDAMAVQLDYDTQANITTERQDADVYLSREAASYASAGVLATTGSPLAAQITNAGRFEKKIQQDWVSAQEQEAAYRSQGKVGMFAGQAQAQSDRIQGSIALINGGARIAGRVGSIYESGVFNTGTSSVSGAPTSTDLSTNFMA